MISGHDVMLILFLKSYSVEKIDPDHKATVTSLPHLVLSLRARE